MLIILLVLMPLLSWCSSPWLRSRSNCSWYLGVIIRSCTTAILGKEISNVLPTSSTHVLLCLDIGLLIIVRGVILEVLPRLTSDCGNSAALRWYIVIVRSDSIERVRASVQKSSWTTFCTHHAAFKPSTEQCSVSTCCCDSMDNSTASWHLSNLINWLVSRVVIVVSSSGVMCAWVTIRLEILLMLTSVMNIRWRSSSNHHTSATT